MPINIHSLCFKLIKPTFACLKFFSTVSFQMRNKLPRIFFMFCFIDWGYKNLGLAIPCRWSVGMSEPHFSAWTAWQYIQKDRTELLLRSLECQLNLLKLDGTPGLNLWLKIQKIQHPWKIRDTRYRITVRNYVSIKCPVVFASTPFVILLKNHV